MKQDAPTGGTITIGTVRELGSAADSLGSSQRARIIAESDMLRPIVNSKLPAATLFVRLVGLARDTPAGDLCEAWELHHAIVEQIKKGKRPMTIREVGTLADLLGIEALLDALNGPTDDVARRDSQRVC